MEKDLDKFKEVFSDKSSQPSSEKPDDATVVVPSISDIEAKKAQQNAHQ